MVEQMSITSGSDISRLQQIYSSGKPIFMLIRKDRCPPCEETKPHWMQIPKNEEIKPLDIVVADVEEQALNSLDFMNPPVHVIGFPTMIHIKHKQIHPFVQGRTVDAFVNWIKSKSTFKKSTFEKSGAKSRAKSKSTFKKGGAKSRARAKRKTKRRRRGKR